VGPDGKSLAFVSDRTGAANIFLYELGGEIYQLTDFFTGAQSATPLTALSWAQKADRLAFVLRAAEQRRLLDHQSPALKRDPYRPAAARADAAPSRRCSSVPGGHGPAPHRCPRRVRAGHTRRRRASAPRARPGARRLRRQGHRATLDRPAARLRHLDLPDSAEFTVVPYKRHYTPETARPSIGYTRDNFGNGIYGGGDTAQRHARQLLHDLRRLRERPDQRGRILGAYVDVSNRFNWAVGFQQRPQFWRGPPSSPMSQPGEYTYVSEIRRLIFRELFGRAYYPINRFRRLEFGLTAANIDDATAHPRGPSTRSRIPTREPQEVTTYRPW
jgi:hypothetical protein